MDSATGGANIAETNQKNQFTHSHRQTLKLYKISILY